jgi:hypothetical protein
MWRISYLRDFVFCCCAISVLGGCTVSNPRSMFSSTLPTSGGTTSSGSTSSGSIFTASIYLVASNFATDKSWSPDSIIIFSQTTTGYLGDEVPNWEIAGSQVSVDSAGNIYVLTDNEIEVIPPVAPLLGYSRTLPIGSGTKISAVVDMTASASGEIFISDGKGIAVFGATATGNADPARYILGNTQPGGGSSTAITPRLIAVDSSDNLYAQNLTDSSIDVFGPTDTGNVVPERIIAGSLTHLTAPVSGSSTSTPSIQGMTTDAAGNLYVLCLCTGTGGWTDFGVFEFGPTANGNVAPIRFVTDPRMLATNGQGGVAVDTAGTIYVSASTVSGSGTIFEFPSSASDIATASNTVTSLYGSSLGGIAVH